MLDKDGIRQLAYVTLIDSIEPIEGSDNCECAVVGGWRVMVHKNEFLPNDPAVYFEIDSKLDSTNPAFAFMERKHYAVKTQKYTFGGKGNFISQGLLMSATSLGWNNYRDAKGRYGIIDSEGNTHFADDESRFLTEKLNVTYYVPEDNKRKAKPIDKYKSMAQRHSKLFSHRPFRWLMRREWGKKILFIFFGKKRDKKTGFPTHFPYVKKTDQERCENMKWVLDDKKTHYYVTEKCDGSSATYILERKKFLFFNRYEFYVCSRNVRMLKPTQDSFFDRNYYWDCAIKYDIENKLKEYLKFFPKLKYVCWQGEVCGPKIQSNPHGLRDVHLFLFHMTDSEVGRYDLRTAMTIWKNYDMETVPVIDENYVMPDDFEEFKASAEGNYSPNCCEGLTKQPREGLVYYSMSDPTFSFKNVARSYLLKK